ncbi:unnamed protein product [Polarella glacialis]|uniref:RING-type domain-containing protein n=1 Tax=Polarella glacialis TaxID=89957 RepID=A0A813KIS3_POLGL|nr:unnamed protein product [Polarella glacialis]
MDFLQQLNEVSCQAWEQQQQQHVEHEGAAEALMEEFQKGCLLVAQEGQTECRYEDDLYIYFNHGNFSNGWEKKPKFQDKFVVLLETRLRETFGPNSQTSASLTEGRHGIALAAKWPEPTHRVVQHPISHAPRSNMNSQCPVCLCRAEVVALTPCGHVLCVSCSTNFHRGTTCPVCREQVAGRQNLFS